MNLFVWHLYCATLHHSEGQHNKCPNTSPFCFVYISLVSKHNDLHFSLNYRKDEYLFNVYLFNLFELQSTRQMAYYVAGGNIRTLF